MTGEERRLGQMSVETALLVPVVLAVVALLVQPACVLYTRAVMAATAGELARLAATSRGGEDELRSFALRRLAAVPDVPAFHEGGPAAWDVEVTGPSDDGAVEVLIVGRVRPLPLLGAFVSMLGTGAGGSVELRVRTSGSLRAQWIGGEYADWVEMWG